MFMAAGIASCSQAQEWHATPPGNVVIGGEYLGAAAGSLVPLLLKTVANQPIHLSTNNALRLRLLENLPGQIINGYPGLNLTGFMGLGQFLGAPMDKPYSLLHLDAGGFQDAGYRPWMRNGMTITHGSDLGWIGLKDEGGDRNFMTIQWSDNNTFVDGPDCFRWIFTRNNFVADVASSLNGLECGRIRPAANGNESFFGIGDFNSVGLNPDERLDLLDKTIRLRSFADPLLYRNDLLDRVLVADATDGRVYWRLASTFGACDWTIQPGNDVSTAYDPGVLPDCPAHINDVGVGVQDPSAKVDVLKDTPEDGGGDDVGVRSVVKIDGGAKVGVDSYSQNHGDFNCGYRASVNNATKDYGAYVLATGNGSASGAVVGGFFQADGAFQNCKPIAVWGRAINDCSGNIGYAAFFEGKGFLSAPMWTYSDSQLKQNIEDVQIDEALNRIMQLRTKTYTFNIAEFPHRGLPEGLQRGLLSQDVADIYPDLVQDMSRPAVSDEQGNVVEQEISAKVMNYQGLIPDLAASIQSLNNRIDVLQQQLNECCNSGILSPHSPVLNGGDGTTGSVRDERLMIFPNPIANHTTLRYYVPQQGKVSLQVSGSDGRLLSTLREEQADAGEYSYEWNTTGLTAGTYFCALLVDGTVVVKKAVKVAER